jgi:Na+/melibiose symporter-like transporter
MLTLNLLGFVGFTVSRFLHGVARSDQRATLLSVKGLVFNLGYGLWSLAFSVLLAGIGGGDAHALRGALGWQFAIIALLVIPFFARALWRRA